MPISQPLEIWRDLTTAAFAPLLKAAGDCAPGEVRAISRLRKKWDAAHVTAALDLLQARRKAHDKWPRLANTLMADTSGIEQATSQRVAAYKAQRLLKLNQPLIDLCCGIGGDTLALGPEVIGVDKNPVRAWMMKKNTGCPAIAADVRDIQLGKRLFHLDPSRRDGRGRLHRYEAYQPGPDFILELLRRHPTGAIKLGPGVDPQVLPPGELEFISEVGRLVQAVLWTGDLTDNLSQTTRRATLLPGPHILQGQPHTPLPPLGPIGSFVMTFDPAVERAQLTGLLCEQLETHMLHPRAGLLTASSARTSPWVRNFQVLEMLPWRLKRVKQCITHHDGGLVEVKTRGHPVDPNILQKKLKGPGSQRLTVFVVRLGDKVHAIITRRVSLQTDPSHAFPASKPMPPNHD